MQDTWPETQIIYLNEYFLILSPCEMKGTLTWERILPISISRHVRLVYILLTILITSYINYLHLHNCTRSIKEAKNTANYNIIIKSFSKHYTFMSAINTYAFKFLYNLYFILNSMSISFLIDTVPNFDHLSSFLHSIMNLN